MKAHRSHNPLAINMPVSVWVDGEDPEKALPGQVCLVGRDCIRVRVPQAFPPQAQVRVKAPNTSRSMKGQVSATFDSGDGRVEIAIYAKSAGAYLGVWFPAEHRGAEVLEAPDKPAEGAPSEQADPQAESEPETALAAEVPPEFLLDLEPEPQAMEAAVSVAPATESSGPAQALPGSVAEVPGQRLEVIISGMDCAKCAFSQPATGTLDASGSLRVHLRQLVDLGSRVRLVLNAKQGADRERNWHCRVYSRSPIRTPEGLWIYRLVFEQVQDLFRELDLPAGGGVPGSAMSSALLAELNSLRTVVVALVYHMRKHGLLEDDNQLDEFLSRDLGPGSLSERMS